MIGGAQKFIGIVTAARRMPKTITVTVTRSKVHPVVGKTVRKRTRMLTHDPEQLADVGDTVVIQACAPVSAAKRHKLIEIQHRAQVVGGVREGVAATEEVTTLAEAKKDAQALPTQPTPGSAVSTTTPPAAA